VRAAGTELWDLKDDEKGTRIEMLFRDRSDAGRRLADRLVERQLREPVILALTRGGVPVAAPIAEALECPVVPYVARKIGAPGHPEFGIGAVAEGAEDILVSPSASRLGLSEDDVTALAREEQQEITRQVDTFRDGHPLPDIAGREVVVVDDGLATGVTAEAALRTVKRKEPRRLILAVPVCASDTASRIAELVDEVVCLTSSESFGSVGQWYDRFEQTSDDEVRRIVGAGSSDGGGSSSRS